ncbi:MAG: hypothetical protein BRD23_04035 [Halobacteriales archaeon SW_9_67_25]|nr:MAG: hypothetical protein BRD23_04035 [Halobacteriales archaeon SW_9_67_25]
MLPSLVVTLSPAPTSSVTTALSSWLLITVLSAIEPSSSWIVVVLKLASGDPRCWCTRSTISSSAPGAFFTVMLTV